MLWWLTKKMVLRTVFLRWRVTAMAAAMNAAAETIALAEKTMERKQNDIWQMSKERLLEVATAELNVTYERASKLNVAQLRLALREHRQALKDQATASDPLATMPKGAARMRKDELVHEMLIRNLEPGKKTRPEMLRDLYRYTGTYEMLLEADDAAMNAEAETEEAPVAAAAASTSRTESPAPKILAPGRPRSAARNSAPHVKPVAKAKATPCTEFFQIGSEVGTPRAASPPQLRTSPVSAGPAVGLWTGGEWQLPDIAEVQYPLEASPENVEMLVLSIHESSYTPETLMAEMQRRLTTGVDSYELQAAIWKALRPTP